jgi:deoxyadenosine/deoxycytidine kinase
MINFNDSYRLINNIMNSVKQSISSNIGKKWFIIEGNIGTGKSTFLKKLNEDLDCEIIYEPLEQWVETKDEDNKNILDHFYKDTNRWCFTFQVNALITRSMSINKPQENKYRFVERSVFTDKLVFAENSYQSGNMNQIEMGLYNKYFDWIQEHFETKPDGIIYLKADPKISYKRIKKRSRDEESIIPLDYIKKIHEKHENWLQNENNVLIIDANLEFENNKKNFNDMIDKIKRFVETV